MDFIDTCVIIGYFNPEDDHYNLCRKFLQSRNQPYYITLKTDLEFRSTMSIKINKAIGLIIKHFRGIYLTSVSSSNKAIIKKEFKIIKYHNKNLENFLGLIEHAAIRLVSLQGSNPDIGIIVDWATEIRSKYDDIIYDEVKIKECIQCISEQDLLRFKDVVKVTLGLNFKDDYDKTIFNELAVITYKEPLVEFFTIDHEFYKTGLRGVRRLTKSLIKPDSLKLFYLLHWDEHSNSFINP